MLHAPAEQIVHSTPMLRAAATQHTLTLFRYAVKKLIHSLSALHSQARLALLHALQFHHSKPPKPLSLSPLNAARARSLTPVSPHASRAPRALSHAHSLFAHCRSPSRLALARAARPHFLPRSRGPLARRRLRALLSPSSRPHARGARALPRARHAALTHAGAAAHAVGSPPPPDARAPALVVAPGTAARALLAHTAFAPPGPRGSGALHVLSPSLAPLVGALRCVFSVVPCAHSHPPAFHALCSVPFSPERLFQHPSSDPPSPANARRSRQGRSTRPRRSWGRTDERRSRHGFRTGVTDLARGP